MWTKRRMLCLSSSSGSLLDSSPGLPGSSRATQWNTLSPIKGLVSGSGIGSNDRCSVTVNQAGEIFVSLATRLGLASLSRNCLSRVDSHLHKQESDGLSSQNKLILLCTHSNFQKILTDYWIFEYP